MSAIQYASKTHSTLVKGDLSILRKSCKGLIVSIACLCVIQSLNVVRVSSVFADDAVQQGSVIQEKGYRVDDVRDLVGKERKCGYSAREALFDEARQLSLGESTVEIVEEVLGDSYTIDSANREALLKYIDFCIKGLTESMENGHAVEIVIKQYEEVLKAIEAYELEMECTWVENVVNSDEREKQLLVKLQDFEDLCYDNVVVGENLGFQLNVPVTNSELAVAFEETEEQLIILKERFNLKEDFYSLFIGTVKDIEKIEYDTESDSEQTDDEHGEIVQLKEYFTEIGESIKLSGVIVEIETSDNLSAVYYLSETSLEVGDTLKQGDSVGKVKEKKYCGLRVVLDGEPIDPLLLMGSNGAYLKNVYVRENPAKQDKGVYDLIDFKNKPTEDKQKSNKDTSVIEGTLK